jgi:hypothetical protein
MKYTIYVLYEGQLASSYPTYKICKVGFKFLNVGHHSFGQPPVLAPSKPRTQEYSQAVSTLGGVLPSVVYLARRLYDKDKKTMKCMSDAFHFSK